MRRVDVLGMGLAVVIAIACGPGEVSAVVGRHDRPDESFVKLGARFEAAGMVVPDGGCTLIGPRWAATAAHVAQSLRPGHSQLRFAGREYTVKRVTIHPEGKSQPGRPPEVDLALVELTEDVEGVTPAALYKKTDELNKEIFIVGYGDVGDGRTKPKRSDGKRRAVTNIITDAGPMRIFCKFDQSSAGTDLEGVGGPGDSGGPAIIEIDGKIYLAGVSSASMNGRPGRYGVTDVYTRISSYVDWIEQSMGAEKPDRD